MQQRITYPFLLGLAILLSGAIFFGFITQGKASSTGTVTGIVFNDDNRNFYYDVPTDSNGIRDINVPEDKMFLGVNIRVDDGYTIQSVHTDFDGRFVATVQTDFPVTVIMNPVFIDKPWGYIPTTDMVHTVEVSPGETVEIPDFGWGPSGYL